MLSSLSGIGGAACGGERRAPHRRDTSGLLVGGENRPAPIRGWPASSPDAGADRRYLAIAHGVIDPADARLRGLPGVARPGSVLRIATLLGRHPPTASVRRSARRGRHAVTRARLLESFGTPAAPCWSDAGWKPGTASEIRAYGACGIGTGRRSCLLVGQDALRPGRWGWMPPPAVADFPRQALHAAELGFEHPVSGRRLSPNSPLPSDIGGAS